MKKIGRHWFFVIGGIVLFSVPFLVILYNAFSTSDVNTEIAAVLLGTIVSAIVTVFLLRGQTEIEENKEISLHIFEKKQDVYFDFIETLERITQDGRINIPGTPSYTEPAEGDVNDELQHLIYQMGKLQMTADFETAQAVTNRIGSILAALRDEGKDKRSRYSDFAAKIFDLVSILREDLYHDVQGNKDKAIGSESIREVLDLIDFGTGKGKEFSQDTLVLSQFLDSLKERIVQKYSLRSYFIAFHDDGQQEVWSEDISSRLAAEIFLDMKPQRTALQVCIPVRNEFVWLELLPGQVQGGFRMRKNGKWGGWSRRMFPVENQMDFKGNPAVLQRFTENRAQFADDFLAGFAGLDAALSNLDR